MATFTWKSYLKVESAVPLERSNRLSDFPDGNRMFQIQDKDRGGGELRVWRVLSLRTLGYTEDLHIREYRLSRFAWMRVCGEPSNGVRPKMQTRVCEFTRMCTPFRTYIRARTCSPESYIRQSLLEIEMWVTRIT